MKVLPELLGASPGIIAVRERIERYLAGRSATRRPPPILVEGETGTGKGLLAHLIHRLGPRSAAAFVDVNCAAIPDTLIEAELFGFERGAFTDARQAKPGLFQTAHGGTIFLDEIALLPDAAQAKLLKVLEERAVRRLGSTKSEPADVAVISATNESLERAVRERRFRADLYHRLAVLTITLPPLRERGDDILVLAEHFLARACADYGLPPRTLSSEARAALRAYRWPGNVRQLANVAERAALLVEDATIGIDALELPELPGEAVAASTMAPASEPGRGTDDERQALVDALRVTGWNVSRAAARLGLSRNTIRYRIEKHGLLRGAPEAPPAAPAPPARREPLPVARAAAPAAPARQVLRWQPRRLAFLHVAVRAAALSGSGRALEVMVDKAQLFGARVDDLGAAGLWAVFGLEPVEDAPRRAANAALAMRRAVEQIRGPEVGGALAIAAGIHVAEVSIGHVGDLVEMDRTGKQAAWATVEELLREAQEGSIVISEAAAPFLGRRFEIGPAPGSARGVFRLLAHEPTGFRLGGQATVFVNREEELEILKARWETACGGHGQVVGVVGDAGMGKSRLLFEFRRGIPPESAGYLEGRCVSYGTGSPYLPLVEIVRGAAGATDTDTPEQVVEKLHAALTAVRLDATDLSPYLAHLLGIKEDAERLQHLSPEALHTRVFDTLRQWIVRLSRARPLIVAVEDLHWIDPSSEAFLGALVDGVAAARVLLAFTSRSGYRPPWVDRSFVTQVALPPLPPTHCPAVVRSVLGARSVPASLMDAVLQRAEGNPFFLEELARAVDDRGDMDVTVPATIQEVLLARIDRLPDEARRALQAAAVIGREVPARFLAALWDGPESLETALQSLARAGFVHEQPGAAEPTHVFKHTLTREVAYGTLSPERGAALHAVAGELLEKAYGRRLEEVYDRLAYHFVRAGDVDKSLLYLTLLADKAAASYAHAEAVDALAEARALAAGRLAPGPARDRRLVDVALRAAHSLHFLGRFTAALERLTAEADAIGRLDDAGRAGHYHFWLARTYSVLGDRDRTAVHLHEALELAARAGDVATFGKASFVRAYEDYWSGRPADGLTHGREAVSALERTQDTWWLGMAHWVIALNGMLAGDFATARAAAAQAEAVGARIGDARLETYAAWTLGWVAATVGDVETGLEACRRSAERSRDPVNTAYALGQQGHACLEGGDAGRAADLLDDAVTRLTAFHPGFRQTRSRFLALLAQAQLEMGQADTARVTASQALEMATAVGFPYAGGLARRVLGRVAIAAGDRATARAHVEASRETFERMGARFEIARSLVALAEVAVAEGASAEASSHLAEATRRFAEVGAVHHEAAARRSAEALRQRS